MIVVDSGPFHAWVGIVGAYFRPAVEPVEVTVIGLSMFGLAVGHLVRSLGRRVLGCFGVLGVLVVLVVRGDLGSRVCCLIPPCFA